MTLSVLFLLSAVLVAATPRSAEPPAPVHVDERIELLTILARLAGADEFAMANSHSPYSERVERHFGPFREHAAVRAFAAMREEYGVGFDAVPSLALHVDGVPSLVERVPFDPKPARLDERWKLQPTRDLLVKLREFAAASRAAEFFASERGFYAQVEARMGELVVTANAVPWFDAFFGAKADASYVVIPGLLCGGGNYGVGVVFADGRPEEIRPVLGCWAWDADGVPVFKANNYLPTFVHELCHSYTNPIVDRHFTDLEAAATRMYPPVARVMRPMAYANGKTVVYESMVRACVIRYLADRQGADAAKQEAERQTGAGFTWVPDLAALLALFSNDRTKYPTLDAYMPEIVRFFDARADALVKDYTIRQEKAPRLLSITPVNGSRDVEPSTDTMTLVFDRPMKTTGWSFVGAKDDVPEFIGKPIFSDGGRSFVVTIRLVPGHTYRFSLNSQKYQGFVGADGTPLEPVDVTFMVKGF